MFKKLSLVYCANLGLKVIGKHLNTINVKIKEIQDSDKMARTYNKKVC